MHHHCFQYEKQHRSNSTTKTLYLSFHHTLPCRHKTHYFAGLQCYCQWRHQELPEAKAAHWSCDHGPVCWPGCGSETRSLHASPSCSTYWGHYRLQYCPQPPIILLTPVQQWQCGTVLKLQYNRCQFPFQYFVELKCECYDYILSKTVVAWDILSW